MSNHTLPETLRVYEIESMKNTTIFTCGEKSLHDMLTGKTPCDYFRVMHDTKMKTKPFITRHTGENMVWIIEEGMIGYDRLFNLHARHMA